MQTDHADHMGEPHPGGQTLTGDIPEGEYQVAVGFEQADEIPGKMAHREDLGGDLKRPAAQQAWAAKHSLHLGSLEEHAAQVVVLATHLGKLVLEGVATRHLRQSDGLDWAPGDLRSMNRSYTSPGVAGLYSVLHCLLLFS
jgi:hypothetical protein